MDQRVQRVFIVSIVLFSIAFGILSIYFRSSSILGFSGDYWAGIFCVGIALLITGFVVLLNFPDTMNRRWVKRLRFRMKQGERVPYLAYVSITISSIGIIFCVILFLVMGEFEVLPLYICIPPSLSLIAIILSKLSLDDSIAIKSERGKYWSKIGLILAFICFFSPWILLFIVSFALLFIISSA